MRRNEDQKWSPWIGVAILLGGCGGVSPKTPIGNDAGSAQDSGPLFDGGTALPDGSSLIVDSGSPSVDASAHDAGVIDASLDAGGKTLPLGVCPPTPTGVGFVRSPHGKFPSEIYGGGPMVTSPQVVTFTFTDTANGSAVDSFGETILQSSWFSAVTGQYCEGDGGPCITPGSTGVSVPMGIAAGSAIYVDPTWGTSTTGTNLWTFITGQIQAAVSANTIPAPDGNGVYVFYFPSTAQIFMGPPSTGNGSCGFAGYHSALAYPSGQMIVYAIIADCSAGNVEGQTLTASHEIVEGVTDSDGDDGWNLDLPATADASWTADQVRDIPWAQLLGYSELADNCEGTSGVEIDGGTWVSRIWSASAATQGSNPCVPVPAGEIYANASSDKALYVADVGVPFTVTVSAWSDAVTAAWDLSVQDATQTSLMGDGGKLPYLDMVWTTSPCVSNGYEAILTVTILADPTTDSSLSPPWAEAVILNAKETTSAPLWPFAVTTPLGAAQIGVGTAGVPE